ncbi:MAG: endonuclease/exonuclease/phosphatase family protein [Clostridia bacterium]|nr:endonuclease/exonuclease/phosphatase family protein [Clostridia bacterium]
MENPRNTTLRIVTFNARYMHDGDGENNFLYRLPLICDTIRRNDPDIICFQEITLEMRGILLSEFPEWPLLGGGLWNDHTNETPCIAYRRQRLMPTDVESFWLSPSSNEPSGFPIDQSICMRLCVAATFQPLDGGSAFRVFNTHTDHVGSVSRLLATGEILAHISRADTSRRLPLIITGDLNATPEAPEIELIRKYQAHPVRDITADIKASYHGFGRVRRDVKIDYIFTDLETVSVEPWTDSRDGLTLSDHYPIGAELKLPLCEYAK